MVSSFSKQSKQSKQKVEPQDSDSSDDNNNNNNNNNNVQDEVSDSSVEEKPSPKKQQGGNSSRRNSTKSNSKSKPKPSVPLSDDDSDDKSEASVPVSTRKGSAKKNSSKQQKEESDTESEASEVKSSYKAPKDKKKKKDSRANDKSMNKSQVQSDSSMSEEETVSPKKTSKKHKKANVETSSISSAESSPARSSKKADKDYSKSKVDGSFRQHAALDDSTSFVGRKADKKNAGDRTRDEDGQDLNEVDRETIRIASKILGELGGYKVLTDKEKKTKFVSYANKNKLDIYDFMANYSTSKTTTLKSMFVHFNNKLGVYYVGDDKKPKFVYIRNSKQLKNIMRDHKRMYFPVVDFKMQCVLVEESLFPEILKTYMTVVDQQTALRKYMWYSTMVNVYKLIQVSMEELKLGKQDISKALKSKKDKYNKSELKPFHEYHRKIVHYIDLFTFRYTGAFALYLEVKAQVEAITCKEYNPHLCVPMKDEFLGTKSPVQLGRPERLMEYVI